MFFRRVANNRFMFFRGSSRSGRDDRNSSTPSRVGLVFLLLFSGFFAAQTQTMSAPEPGSGIEGAITLGPTRGGPVRPGVSDSKPFANATFIVESETGVVTVFGTDDQGRFRISLAPGHYAVSLKDKQLKMGHYGPFNVDVVAGQMTKVGWYCDTGMR
jgi:hypothetical protein